jgi:hypothetical protein
MMLEAMIYQYDDIDARVITIWGFCICTNAVLIYHSFVTSVLGVRTKRLKPMKYDDWLTKISLENAQFNLFHCPEGPRTNESSIRRYISHRKHDIHHQPFIDSQPLSPPTFLRGALRYSSSPNAQERLHCVHSMLILDYGTCRYGL